MTTERGADESESPQKTSLLQEFDSHSLYAVRSAVAAHAVALGLPEERLSTLLLIATELATNAFRHGGGSGRLRLWRTEESVFLQVSDDGPGLARPQEAGRRPAPLSSPGGRGLWIVRQIADHLDITTEPGTTITAGLDV
ncbi:ATP-binding protein [Actinoplanes awajinensis]|uniref:Histidine kinase/HSP90-like ATPase domain-containing protein n=1 Tax=Actinoplanes awajinensis subsp. mycoplanecinus TaxID=135947 RepID=A0A101JM50_9ACTN|nr:ATP-binding protein [Actinoplanes awajinensis]KUL29450.1 hypothetical protein ADL15_27930 [Actinoplanes awajinensis subsp. mycoplanecinus]